MSTRISPSFLGLSDKQRVEWNSRTVSTFHALLVGIFCLYILLFDDVVNEDPVWGDPTLVKTNVAITTGYLISDLLLIFYYWKAIGDKFFVVHHLAALYACYYVLVSALLSNSRTCRQDGTETTKGEQLCPVKLSVFNIFCHCPVRESIKLSVVSFFYANNAPKTEETHNRRRKCYGWLSCYVVKMRKFIAVCGCTS